MRAFGGPSALEPGSQLNSSPSLAQIPLPQQQRKTQACQRQAGHTRHRFACSGRKLPFSSQSPLKGTSGKRNRTMASHNPTRELLLLRLLPGLPCPGKGFKAAASPEPFRRGGTGPFQVQARH